MVDSMRRELTMKAPASLGPRAGVLAGFIFLLLGVPPRAASAATVVAKDAVNTPVTVTDNGRTWTLDNGIVQVTVSKTSGNFRSLVYRGMETMSAGGSWEQN